MPEHSAERLMAFLLEKKYFFEVYAGDRPICQSNYVNFIHSCGMDEKDKSFYFMKMQIVSDILIYLKQNHLCINKVFVSIANTSHIPIFRKEVETIPHIKTFLSGEHFIEIVPDGADKQVAVRAVCKDLGLSKQQTMAIGDSENDIGMFAEAGLCVAMENACPELKQKADFIAPSNKEDGVAWVLENLMHTLP